MSLDFSGLTDLAAKGTKAKQEWQPLTAADLGYGSVLCFDQSLTATGTVLLQHVYPGTNPVVVKAQQWSTDFEGKDVLTSLRRGEHVYRNAITAIHWACDVGIDMIVHESPPNPAAVKGGGYSSMLAAQALRCAVVACEGEGVDVEMLGAQPAKKLVCGNANADKKTAHAALKESVLPWIVNSQQITNEATRDSLMIGLLWLSRRK